jgi:transcriptional regulator with XRE-family HTH domain
MIITPEQVKNARKLLGWSERYLAVRAGVSRSAIRVFEAGDRDPSEWVSLAIRKACEARGVEFTNGGQPGSS